MDKFQIVEVTGKSNNAGTKAPADAAKIAESMGYKPVYVRMATTKPGFWPKLVRQVGYKKDWNIFRKTITDNSVVFLQFPFHRPQWGRVGALEKIKNEKNTEFIALIHDVEELRQFCYNSYYKKEFDIMLSLSDYFIVHNEIMKEFFITKGIPENRIVCLGIFDYLCDSSELAEPAYKKAINVAGNLDVKKSGYIGELKLLEDIEINLYGSHFDEKMLNSPNIKYHGAFPAEVLPSKLTGGFGLVWDGDSIETCSGNTGQYLKYNNPHKLSLYLASGLPVIVWKNAATAKFVKENNCGITVESLFEAMDIVKHITEAEYVILAKNALDMKKKVCCGHYLSAAFKAISKLGELYG